MSRIALMTFAAMLALSIVGRSVPAVNRQLKGA